MNQDNVKTVDEAKEVVENYSLAIGKDPMLISGSELAKRFDHDHVLMLRGLELLRHERGDGT